MSRHSLLIAISIIALHQATPNAFASDTFSVGNMSPTHTVFLDQTQMPDDVLLAMPAEATGEDAGGVGPTLDLDGSRLARRTIGPFGGWLDIDGISSNHGLLDVQCIDHFHIIFSVNFESQGNLGTCVHDQFDLAQQGGDMFKSTASFQPILPDGVDVEGVEGDNDCYINQDTLHLVPSIGDGEANADPIDELDGFDFREFDIDNDGDVDIPMYYSVTDASDPFLGAFIFCLPEGWDAAPAEPFELPPVYAAPIHLLLLTGDEIDALIVYDGNENETYDAGDVVFLSLKEGTLSLINGGPYTGGGPADVYMVFRDAFEVTHVSIFADAAQLGLGETFDDIDALEVVIDLPEAVWEADFDCLVGGPLVDQAGWESWLNDPNVAEFMVTSAMSHSAPKSLAIDGDDDAVHQYEGVTAGKWTYTTWVMVPTGLSSKQYFALANTYPTTGWSSFSTILELDGPGGVVREYGSGVTMPMAVGTWAEIRVEIDLDQDTQTILYNGNPLITDSWTGAFEQGGTLCLAAVDLWGNASQQPVWYDDMKLEPAPATPCAADISPTGVGDGVVNIADLLAVIANWGPCPPTGNCAADINGSFAVGVDDLLLVIANWGPCE